MAYGAEAGSLCAGSGAVIPFTLAVSIRLRVPFTATLTVGSAF